MECLYLHKLLTFTIMKPNYTVFTTFLSDKWKLDKMPDEIAGKMWKALVNFFITGNDFDFGDTHYQYVYEDFKQTCIRNAMKNKKKNDNRSKEVEEPQITVNHEQH